MHDVAGRILKALEAEITARGGDWATIKAYTQDKYRADIFAAAATYWKDGSRGGFNTRMKAAVKFGLQDAFQAGADEIGLEPADLLNEDLAVRDGWITEEQSHIPTLLEYLDNLANNPQSKLSDADSRLETWAARWPDVKGRAIIYLDRDGRYEWVVGPTEQSCPSCQSLNGIVKRASFWESHGIKPRVPNAPYLACHGFNCLCELVPTQSKVTRGRLPRLP